MDVVCAKFREQVMSKTLDIAKLVADHEQIVLGKKVLFVPAEAGLRSERLLVVMSAHNQGGKYMALRSFLEDQKCDLLFISDPKNSWYLDDDLGSSFGSVLNVFVKNYDPKSIFLFGSSMSGYGAIFHAFKLNANAIASNPQINLDVTKDYAWPELIEHINDIGGNHVNLDEISDAEWGDSAVYLIHGHDEIDTINVELLTRSSPPNKKLIVQTLDVDSHVMFFGKEVGYVYAVMDLLASFRKELDLKKLLLDLVPEDKTNKRQLRAERKLSKIHDPYRAIDHSGNAISWQNRYLYQQAGKEVFFSNIGFYTEGKLTGGTCFFDGERWRLCTPIPTIGDDLISVNHLKTTGDLSAKQNNQNINEFWWVRNEAESDLIVNGSLECLEIDLSTANTKNIYLSSALKVSKKQYESLLGKYLTLSADVYTSDGKIYLTLGGYGDSGYHHRNSPTNTVGSWEKIFVTQQFLSINTNHKDSVFVRVNLAADGKPKKVIIKNIRLHAGYFPMGTP